MHVNSLAQHDLEATSAELPDNDNSNPSFQNSSNNVSTANTRLHDLHRQEWRSSYVRADIIDANVVSVQGAAAIAKMFPGNPPSNAKYRYPFEKGGWWVDGLEPNNWDQRMRWGQIKLDEPRVKDGKILKYESPAKQDTRAIFLNDPQRPGLWADVEGNS